MYRNPTLLSVEPRMNPGWHILDLWSTLGRSWKSKIENNYSCLVMIAMVSTIRHVYFVYFIYFHHSLQSELCRFAWSEYSVWHTIHVDFREIWFPKWWISLADTLDNSSKSSSFQARVSHIFMTWKWQLVAIQVNTQNIWHYRIYAYSLYAIVVFTRIHDSIYAIIVFSTIVL